MRLNRGGATTIRVCLTGLFMEDVDYPCVDSLRTTRYTKRVLIFSGVGLPTLLPRHATLHSPTCCLWCAHHPPIPPSPQPLHIPTMHTHIRSTPCPLINDPITIHLRPAPPSPLITFSSHFHHHSPVHTLPQQHPHHPCQPLYPSLPPGPVVAIEA